MASGLLDLPAPLFETVERAAGELPALVRLGLWAALGALVSIEVYRLVSPQRRIAEAMAELRRTQQALEQFDGAFADALPLMGRLLSLAGRRLALVLPAAVIGSLPALALLVWLDGAYGARFPQPGTPVTVRTDRPLLDARWQETGRTSGEVVVTDAEHRPVVRTDVPAPVSRIEKWRWWNLLIGNPAGYLPAAAPVDRIDIDLPKVEVLPLGPSWIRGWEPSFLALFLAFALVARWARRVI